MTKIIIKNAKIINEMQQFEADLAIENGKIALISTHIIYEEGDTVIEATGKYLLPGMIDSQVHFRQPDMSHQGKFITESAAAVAGGITSVLDMPNTSPQTINEKAIKQKHKLIQGQSYVNYGFYLGATNDNIKDIIDCDIRLICGVKVFMGASNGNILVDNEETLENIFKQAKTLVATHCEYSPIINFNEKKAKEKYGDDIPFDQHPLIRSREACIKSTQTAIKLAKKHNTKLHILHISTAEEVAFFEQIPLEQKRITAEACVHFTWFDDRDYAKLGAQIKCNPAIKQNSDKRAIINGINYGNLDIIATDHAPHTWQEKQNKYFKAPSGLPLVQTALASLLTQVNQGKFSLEKIVQKTAHNVADLFQVKKRGYIREGYYADLVLVDLNTPHKVKNKNMLYQCGWTPYDGEEFTASIEKTWVNGKLKWSDGKLIGKPKGMALKYER